MEGRQPTNNAEYKDIAQKMKNWLSDSANLAMMDWDAQGNASLNTYITQTIIPTATQLINLITLEEGGDRSQATVTTLGTTKTQFDACISKMYYALGVSTKPEADKNAAYDGMGLIIPTPRQPGQKSEPSDNTEIIALGYGLFARMILVRLMGNSADGSHKLEKGQLCRRIYVAFVDRDCYNYPDSIFIEHHDTNSKTLQLIIDAIHSGKKMVAYAVYVSKLREEGHLKSPIVEIYLPYWDVAAEEAKDNAALKTTHPDVHNADGSLKAPKESKNGKEGQS